MFCRYIKVKGVGKVLIPECMGVASHYDAPNPLDYCTCKKELSPAQYERQKRHSAVRCTGSAYVAFACARHTAKAAISAMRITPASAYALSLLQYLCT